MTMRLGSLRSVTENGLNSGSGEIDMGGCSKNCKFASRLRYAAGGSRPNRPYCNRYSQLIRRKIFLQPCPPSAPGTRGRKVGNSKPAGPAPERSSLTGKCKKILKKQPPNNAR